MPTVGDGLDVLAGGEIADRQLEPLRPVVVDQGREQAAVGADRERAEAEIFLALGLGILVEDQLVVAAGDGLAVPRRYCVASLNADQ